MTDGSDDVNAMVVRTDFSDEAAWEAICAAIREPVGDLGFRAYVDFLSEPKNDGLTSEQIGSRIPAAARHGFVFIVDRQSLTDKEHPILVVDLIEKPIRTFRVIPSEMWSVENNLSIANMGFEDFENSLDEDGVFRGFPEH